MSEFWAFVAWFLSLISPASGEAPRCAGAVAAAYASMARGGGEPSPVPPEPKPGGCCDECKGTGWITHGDGHKTPCPCPQDCTCKQKGQHKPLKEEEK